MVVRLKRNEPGQPRSGSPRSPWCGGSGRRSAIRRVTLPRARSRRASQPGPSLAQGAAPCPSLKIVDEVLQACIGSCTGPLAPPPKPLNGCRVIMKMTRSTPGGGVARKVKAPAQRRKHHLSGPRPPAGSLVRTSTPPEALSRYRCPYPVAFADSKKASLSPIRTGGARFGITPTENGAAALWSTAVSGAAVSPAGFDAVGTHPPSATPMMADGEAGDAPFAIVCRHERRPRVPPVGSRHRSDGLDRVHP